MNIAALICLILGIIIIIISVICAIFQHDINIALISIFSFPFFILFIVVNWPNPTKNDVKEGKAIYIEEKNTGLNLNGDTIYNYSTYHIEWLPE